jgi:hypothetical protein
MLKTFYNNADAIPLTLVLGSEMNRKFPKLIESPLPSRHTGLGAVPA